ncbi:MAG: prolipoprotein diacylglyceryl transferase family protein [Terracidiphilus sp.]|jgi:membrane-associated phospholipid phosphatase/protein-S-isoprenylcysteine O-methyltransferase Ste14
MMRTLVLKVLYGIVFVVLVPLAFTEWAHATRFAVLPAALHCVAFGACLAGVGIAVMLAATASLWRYGGGLPMNAFPPPRLVERGVYGVVPHPIYGGFVLACAGAAIGSGSASGLWLVTPAAALGCASLVLGYELPDLRRRFAKVRHSCWLPRETGEKPSLIERFRIYFVVLLPWLAIYELLGAMGKPVGAVSTYLPIDLRVPVVEQTEILYASTYVVVILAPLILRSRVALRQFASQGLTAMAVIFPLYLLLPIFVPTRPFVPLSAIGHLLEWERTPFSGIAAFPSFHVVWALIAASALSKDSRRMRWLWCVWAFLVCLSCLTSGMHSMLDVAAGAAIYVLVARIGRVWKTVLRAAERIANSWKEWRFGPVRIINHGGYAAAAVLIGLTIVNTLLGPRGAAVTVSIFLCATVGALLWAQWVEGSPSLLRPMGFYGGMLGGIVGAIPALFLGIDVWAALAALCIAAPWIQGMGRFRCLLQGCCHGRATEDVPGIRYTHPRTRVCRLAQLGGVPIHATQLYSILWNALVGLALLRLLAVHAPETMICGIYLLLSGAGRFVEEAYRGEPQTMAFCGLHIYQWIAALVFVAGAVITVVPTPPMALAASFRMSSVVMALGCAAIAWFVCGIDFPESSRRFARLT